MATVGNGWRRMERDGDECGEHCPVATQYRTTLDELDCRLPYPLTHCWTLLQGAAVGFEVVLDDAGENRTVACVGVGGSCSCLHRDEYFGNGPQNIARTPIDLQRAARWAQRA